VGGGIDSVREDGDLILGLGKGIVDDLSPLLDLALQGSGATFGREDLLFHSVQHFAHTGRDIGPIAGAIGATSTAVSTTVPLCLRGG
jgi:hypothetical protein